MSIGASYGQLYFYFYAAAFQKECQGRRKPERGAMCGFDAEMEKGEVGVVRTKKKNVKRLVGNSNKIKWHCVDARTALLGSVSCKVPAAILETQ